MPTLNNTNASLTTSSINLSLFIFLSYLFTYPNLNNILFLCHTTHINSLRSHRPTRLNLTRVEHAIRILLWGILEAINPIALSRLIPFCGAANCPTFFHPLLYRLAVNLLFPTPTLEIGKPNYITSLGFY